MATPEKPDSPHNKTELSEYLSQAIGNFDNAQSYDRLKKAIDELNHFIQTKGSDIVKDLWNQQNEQIQACLEQLPLLDVNKFKIVIERMLIELKMVNDQQSAHISNVSASNKPVSNLYERISYFVQARKEHRAILRQEKNDQLNKIDAIIRVLHMIKKGLIQYSNEGQLEHLKNEVNVIKEQIHNISKSRAYDKSNTVMMNADSAMTKLSALLNQIDKKLNAVKSKKTEKILPAAGIMRKLVSRVTKKVELKSIKNDNSGNDDDPSPHRSKNK